MVQPLIINDQDHPELMQLWLARAQRDLPDVHENRHQQWASGRVALTEAFRLQGIALPLDCHFLGHQQVREFPNWRFSLSNTEGYGAAVLVKSGSVGLDIEKLDRKVAEGVRQRMCNPGDATLSAIELWCAKEAVYKALPSEVQSKIWLNNISILEKTFSVNEIKGNWQRQSHAELIVMLATL